MRTDPPHLILTTGARATLAAAALVTAVVGAVLLVRPSWRATLHDSLVRRPASVTELYFDPRDPLPATLRPGDRELLHYVVANVGGTARSYAVTVAYDGGATTEETLSLPPGGRAARTLVLEPGAVGTRCGVTVSLSPSQRITYSAQVRA